MWHAPLPVIARLQGAELIVALSHMRTPNDLVLAANVPEIQVGWRGNQRGNAAGLVLHLMGGGLRVLRVQAQRVCCLCWCGGWRNSRAHCYCDPPNCKLVQLILGGHDHHYEITRSEPHGTLVFKSGTDFREFSILRVGVPRSLQGERLRCWLRGVTRAAQLAGLRWAACSGVSETVHCSLSYPPLAAERPLVEHKRVEINSSVPEDPEMAAIVRKYQDLIGETSCGVSCCSGCRCASPVFVALDGMAQRLSHGA